MGDDSYILDYSDFYEDTYEYSRKGPLGKVELIPYREPSSTDVFFGDRGFCPFCRVQMDLVYEKTKHGTLGRELWTTTRIWECRSCGWWESFEQFNEEDDLLDAVDTANWDTLRRGIVKKFNVSDKELPVSSLLSELKKRQDVLYDIDPYKLEELAQIVFSAYYDCEVKHVGKSGDGGTDLIIVHSDDPILVQVKRRRDPKRIELVKEIREFVGAMYINDAKRGIFLSTAKDFSRGSKDTAKKLLDDRKFERFDLVDFDKFCGMLDVLKKSADKPWKRFAE